MRVFILIWFWLLTLMNFVIPKNKNMIVIYGRKMLNDNAEALLDYLLDNNYEQKYRIYVLISKSVLHCYKETRNFKIVTSSFCSIWYVIRARYIFHTHGLSLCKHIPSKRQIIFNMWHGSPLKAIGTIAGSRMTPESDSYFLCASPFFAEINKKCFAINDSQVFIGSNPRNDVLFHRVDIRAKMKWGEYSKIIVMMPTFRNSTGLGRTDAEKDFPVLDETNIFELNKFLSYHNALLVIKPHPYQNSIPFLKNEYSNIKIVSNLDIHKQGLKLYELLGNSDALITDFSSVYFDYLLLDKPIGFAIDDIDNYKANRGYTIDNPLELMPGMKIRTLDSLKAFIESVTDGNDKYKEERKRTNQKCNTFATDDAAFRILNFVRITKQCE